MANQLYPKNNIQKSDVKDFLIKTLAPIFSFIEIAVNIYGFIELWKGDREALLIIIISLAFISFTITIGYISFSKIPSKETKNNRNPILIPRYKSLHKVAKIVFYSMFILATAIIVFFINYDRSIQNKVIALIANFDGTNPKEYRVTDQIINNLNENISGYSDIVIRPLGTTISEQQGSEYARKQGKKYRADFVIWGWYGVNDSKALITLHFENLSQKNIDYFTIGNTSQRIVTIEEWENFTIQQDLSSQMSSLTLFLSGAIRCKSGEYQTAINMIDKALLISSWPNDLLAKSIIYFIKGNCFFHNGLDRVISDGQGFFVLEPESTYLSQAILNYSKAIDLNAGYSEAYLNRGIAFEYFNKLNIDEYKKELSLLTNDQVNLYLSENLKLALADYTNAISADKYNFQAYIKRAELNKVSGNFSEGINDLSIAIDLFTKKPNSLGFSYKLWILYWERGNAFFGNKLLQDALHDFDTSLGQNDCDILCKGLNLSSQGDVLLQMGLTDKALDKYENAIKQAPFLVNNYKAIGMIMFERKEYEKAIDFFSKTILFTPAIPDGYKNSWLIDAYYYRAESYAQINQIESAIDDYTQVIFLDPSYIQAYSGRALLNYWLGHFDETISDLSFCIEKMKLDIYYFYRGSAYLRKEMFSDGKSDLLSALSISKDPELIRRINEILAALP